MEEVNLTAAVWLQLLAVDREIKEVAIWDLMEEDQDLKKQSKKSLAATGEILLKETHLSIRLRLKAGAMITLLDSAKLTTPKLKVDGILLLLTEMTSMVVALGMTKPTTSMETMMIEVTHLQDP